MFELGTRMRDKEIGEYKPALTVAWKNRLAKDEAYYARFNATWVKLKAAEAKLEATEAKLATAEAKLQAAEPKLKDTQTTPTKSKSRFEITERFEITDT